MQLLYLALVIGVFVVPLLFLTFYSWYQDRKNKRTPFTDKFMRSPGQSLYEQIQVLSEEISANVSILIFIPLLLLTPVFINN
jgi:hypothetical protein